MTNLETHNIDIEYARACHGGCADCGMTPNDCITKPCPYADNVDYDRIASEMRDAFDDDTITADYLRKIDAPNYFSVSGQSGVK